MKSKLEVWGSPYLHHSRFISFHEVSQTLQKIGKARSHFFQSFPKFTFGDVLKKESGNFVRRDLEVEAKAPQSF